MSASDGRVRSLKSTGLIVDAAIVHVIALLITMGYAQEYYFHLRMSRVSSASRLLLQGLISVIGHHKNNAH